MTTHLELPSKSPWPTLIHINHPHTPLINLGTHIWSVRNARLKGVGGTTYSVIWCSELLLKPWVYRTGKKVRGQSDFLSENQLMGPQEWIDVKKNRKTLGTTPVPGVKVSANQRPVFGHMTILASDCRLYWHPYISAKNKDNDTKLSGYDPWGKPSTSKSSRMTLITLSKSHASSLASKCLIHS